MKTIAQYHRRDTNANLPDRKQRPRSRKVECRVLSQGRFAYGWRLQNADNNGKGRGPSTRKGERVMRKGFYLVFAVGLLALLCAPQANAAEDGSRYGAGVFVDRNVPVLKFGNRYQAGLKYGATFDYELSSRTTLEFEYHHASLRDGDVENRAFYWPVDKNWYYSPQAKAHFNLNSFILTSLTHLGEVAAGDLRLLPYLAIGAGVYDYQETVSGLIYPGQPVEPLDTSLLLQPQTDDHTPLGATLGLGMTVRQNRFGLDVRARYHMILGDLRPMEAWGVEEVFPISVVDLRTTFKLYW
jgi:hypothetical protein